MLEHMSELYHFFFPATAAGAAAAAPGGGDRDWARYTVFCTTPASAMRCPKEKSSASSRKLVRTNTSAVTRTFRSVEAIRIRASASSARVCTRYSTSFGSPGCRLDMNTHTQAHTRKSNCKHAHTHTYTHTLTHTNINICIHAYA